MVIFLISLLSSLSYQDTFSLLHPGIDLLIWGVNQVISFLIFLNESLHSLDRLGERPSLHLGLEPHVVDLQGETVSVHGELS